MPRFVYFINAGFVVVLTAWFKGGPPVGGHSLICMFDRRAVYCNFLQTFVAPVQNLIVDVLFSGS